MENRHVEIEQTECQSCLDTTCRHVCLWLWYWWLWLLKVFMCTGRPVLLWSLSGRWLRWTYAAVWWLWRCLSYILPNSSTVRDSTRWLALSTVSCWGTELHEIGVIRWYFETITVRHVHKM